MLPITRKNHVRGDGTYVTREKRLSLSEEKKAEETCTNSKLTWTQTQSVYFHELIFPQMRWKHGKTGVCEGGNVRQNNKPLPSLFEIINLL